ncbi:kinase-like domain-containing protein [Mycena sanguinolenta]|nr:kinase-like domain-containing protein [Mycena sanguinolenta]
MSAPAVGASPTLKQKQALFLAAPHFAVVGASTSESKMGAKVLKWLIERSKDVIPVNHIAQEIQGIKCIKSLSELPDPTHTSVSIVVPPKATMAVLQLAKSLGIYSVWIQPGAEDDAVVEFIEADAQFKARCIYLQHATHTAAPKMLASTLHTDTSGSSLFRELSPASIRAASVAPAAALAASNVVALKDVKEITNPGGLLENQLFIASTDIDTWAVGPADAKVPNGDSFRTEADSSQKKPGPHKRELQAWRPSTDDGAGLQSSGGGGDEETFGVGSKGQWDNFNANEKLFGVKRTFDEYAYTTKLDRNAPDFEEREGKRQRIADEIIGAGTNNPHIAEERNQNGDDSGANEEDKHGVVEVHAIHQNFASYFSSSDEIVQLSKQWAQWDHLTSLANYRSVVQILFGYLTKLPNSNRASAQDICNRISADLSCVLQHMDSILSDPTSYKLFLSCRGAVAQQLLDLLQDLLELHDLRFRAPLSKARFFKALLRLSAACGLHPTCFTLNGVEKVGRQVAGGGFGDIWKGLVGGQIVAIKSLRQFADDDVKVSLKKLGHEAVIWRQLSHPNLLPFFGLYTFEHRLCLVSPWMENGDLKLFLSNAPDTDRVSLITDVAMGVEYLHNEHIVHGDLKTPNILVTPSGRACITDFGLSTIVDELSLKMTFSSRNGQAGTVRYQAPELLKNERPNHYGSDVYAFACVSYEILTGKLPFFESTNDAAIILKVAIEGALPSRLEVISRDLWLLLEDCWHQQTDKRPTMTIISQRLSRQGIGEESLPDWDDAYSARFRRSVQEWPLLPSVVEMERRLLSNRSLSPDGSDVPI